MSVHTLLASAGSMTIWEAKIKFSDRRGSIPTNSWLSFFNELSSSALCCLALCLLFSNQTLWYITISITQPDVVSSFHDLLVSDYIMSVDSVVTPEITYLNTALRTVIAKNTSCWFFLFWRSATEIRVGISDFFSCW